ncbi:hypothetical protein MM213_03245 [Belliella sp. R4-6]|uniref:HMA domain-containing protein n=1 Tax=Belliella alkalica TaxID=1730871 RepID=A0ABS9V7U6_9BACT|nr:hypothetical protein [Belliella alkalica]MCH7412487.1 hypothetical protein [Belliella alkalica]
MVEVFCTNIQDPTTANRILNEIEGKFPRLKANFDLEDCDKILRIEFSTDFEPKEIIELVSHHGHSICVLEDIIYPIC